jgi:hypothetical protein
MTHAAQISFAVEVLRWVQPQEGQVKTLTLDQVAEAGKVIVGRIAPVWERAEPFKTFGSAAGGTLHVWASYGDPDELRACLSRRIADDLTEVFRLMRAFTGQSWSTETGVPQIPEFRRETYDTLVAYVDPADVSTRLVEHFGDTVGTGDFYAFRALAPDERLANEFSFIHRLVLEESARTKDAPEPPTE